LGWDFASERAAARPRPEVPPVMRMVLLYVDIAVV
jgi:hypothetical protein